MLSACGKIGDEATIAQSSDITFNAEHIQRGAMTQEDIDNRSVYIYGVQNNT
jgi:hypothetical protein